MLGSSAFLNSVLPTQYKFRFSYHLLASFPKVLFVDQNPLTPGSSTLMTHSFLVGGLWISTLFQLHLDRGTVFPKQRQQQQVTLSSWLTYRKNTQSTISDKCSNQPSLNCPMECHLHKMEKESFLWPNKFGK